jgi:hypothetical protein
LGEAVCGYCTMTTSGIGGVETRRNRQRFHGIF